MFHVTKYLSECPGDSRKLHNLVTNPTTKQAENPLLPGKTDDQLANDFANYFEDKILTIREKFKEIKPYQLTVKDMPKFSRIVPMTESEVELIVKTMKSKTCKLLTTVLKEMLEVVLPVITRIVNLLLSNGQFHNSWKMAIV